MLPMHLELIHVSHCCRTWREMPLAASEHVSPALLLLPSLGHSSTAFRATVYWEDINNCSLGKRHPLLNWTQYPKRLRVQIHSGFPGREVRNLLCALGNNCRVSWLCPSFSMQHREPAGDSAVLCPPQVHRYRGSLSFSEQAKDLCLALPSARQKAQSCVRELLALAGTVGALKHSGLKSYWRVKEPEGRWE